MMLRNQEFRLCRILVSLLPVNFCVSPNTRAPVSLGRCSTAPSICGKSPFSSSAKKLRAINKTFSFFHWIRLCVCVCVCAVALWLYIATVTGCGRRSVGEPGMLPSDLGLGTMLLPKEHKQVISKEDLMITTKHQLNLVQREIQREGSEGVEEHGCSLRHKIMPDTKGEGGEHGSGERQEQFVSHLCLDRNEW